ncbi:MAG: hypothetical protein JSR91_01060 [Proteobacteria bacterium]|nr:hypothetical protein [Pseudomonadota bacterium]
MKRLALLFTALIGMAGVAHAQSQTMHPSMPRATHQTAMARASCGHETAIKDEYGFRYDSMGDRLNTQGCVIAPPHTPPGGRAING